MIHLVWSKTRYDLLSLLCATPQQSFCREVGIRRPPPVPLSSIICKTRFSETIKRVDTKFWGNLPFHHIYRQFCFVLFCFVSNFLIFDFSSALTLMGTFGLVAFKSFWVTRWTCDFFSENMIFILLFLTHVGVCYSQAFYSCSFRQSIYKSCY